MLVMFHAPIPSRTPRASELSALLDRLSRVSTRPRYAFMVLTQIADDARPDGGAGPMVRQGWALVTLRAFGCVTR